MKVYIAGKITGLKNYKEKFKEAQEHLESLGHTVMNPTILEGDFSHEEFMHVCYSMIDICDGVYFLDNWKSSKGANMEHGYSIELGKRIMYQAEGYHDWIPVTMRLPNNEECNKFDDMHPDHRKFLCTIKIANYEPQTRIMFLSEVFGWKYGADDYNKHVIAWKPLPEPYEEA